MIVRSVTSNADTKTRLLKAIGKLADNNISEDSTKHIMDELTELLKGQPFNKETFDQYGIVNRIVSESGKPEILEITVPVEYLPISIAQDKHEAVVAFIVSKVLDMDFRGR